MSFEIKVRFAKKYSLPNVRRIAKHDSKKILRNIPPDLKNPKPVLILNLQL